MIFLPHFLEKIPDIFFCKLDKKLPKQLTPLVHLHPTTNVKLKWWKEKYKISKYNEKKLPGIMKAKVFPDPVTASATTSLLDNIKGIQVAWTGVGSMNPSLVNTSRVVLLSGFFSFNLSNFDSAMLFLRVANAPHGLQDFPRKRFAQLLPFFKCI